jgi:hypothetical protein
MEGGDEHVTMKHAILVSHALIASQCPEREKRNSKGELLATANFQISKVSNVLFFFRDNQALLYCPCISDGYQTKPLLFSCRYGTFGQSLTIWNNP